MLNGDSKRPCHAHAHRFQKSQLLPILCLPLVVLMPNFEKGQREYAYRVQFDTPSSAEFCHTEIATPFLNFSPGGGWLPIASCYLRSQNLRSSLFT